MQKCDYAMLKDMISDLEYIIASECYNSEYAHKKNFRYPVTFEQNGKKYKGKGGYKVKINEATAEQEIRSMEYVFGDNHLCVGNAIVAILDYLQNRYDTLEFYDLERGCPMLKDDM